MSRAYQRLLLTGAAGNLGRVLSVSLRPFAANLRLSDLILPVGVEAGDDFVVCDLADKAAVDQLVRGCDAIVHMGGISTEHSFEEVLEANIRGTFNLYEAARRHGVTRVVFASSNHVMGFHERSTTLDAHSPRRPDGYYGLSKSFGEDLARFYFDRYGIETACLRIGSAYASPRDERMLHTWLSFDDLTELIRASLAAEQLGHTVIYGVSQSMEPWWDNQFAAHVGFEPKDSSEPFRASALAQPQLPQGPATHFQGGSFVLAGPFEPA